jgi:hypothetical protein
MTVMVASEKYHRCLNAFTYGYARKDVRNQGKKIFSIVPFPFSPVLIIILIIILILLFWLSKRKKSNKIDLDFYLTKRNEGVLITTKTKQFPGVLSGSKKDIARLIGISIDKQIIEQSKTPDNIFFLLAKQDLDVLSDQVLEIIADMNVWLFIERNGNSKQMKKFERIGKTVLFDPEYMQTCGIPSVVLGIIPRFLSMISGNGDTNIDHLYNSIPEVSTISFSFPTDVHSSVASILKHQKCLYPGYWTDSLKITNCKEHVNDLTGTARYVEADTEPFFISFVEVR